MRLPASSVFLACLCIAAPANAGFSSSVNYGKAPSPRSPAFVGPSQSVPQPSSPAWGDVQAGPSIGWDLRQAKERIRDAREAGLITRREARQLKREANVIAHHAEIYGRDGLSESELNELQARTLYLQGMANAPNRPGN